MVKVYLINKFTSYFKKVVLVTIVFIVIFNLLFWEIALAKKIEINDKDFNKIKNGLDLLKTLGNIVISDDKIKTALNTTIEGGKTGTNITYGLFVLSAMNEMELIDMVVSQRFKTEATAYFNQVIEERTNLISYWKGIGFDLPRVLSGRITGPISALTLDSFSIGNTVLQIFLTVRNIAIVQMYEGLWGYFDYRRGNFSHDEAWQNAKDLMGWMPEPEDIHYLKSLPFGRFNPAVRIDNTVNQLESQFATLWDKWGPYTDRFGVTETAKRQFKEEMGQIVLESIEHQVLAEKEKDLSLLKKLEKRLGSLIDKTYGFATNLWQTIKSKISKINPFMPAAVVEPSPPMRPEETGEIEEIEETKEEIRVFEEEIVKDESPESQIVRPESLTKSNLKEFQKILDDIAKEIDILTQRVAELTTTKEKEIKKEELEKEKEKEKEICWVDINTAPARELEKIITIGPILAQRIIEARPFYSLNDLLKVKGIGEKTLQKIIAQGCAYVSEYYSQVASLAGGSGSAGTISPPSPPSSPKILISEIQIWDTTSSDHDFIELYNPNQNALDISNWQLKKKNSQGNEESIKVFPSGSIIPGQGYFLWLNTNYASSTGFQSDVTSSQTLAQNNSLALLDKNKDIVDALAWGSSSNPFVKGLPFPQNPERGKSLARKWSTTTKSYINTENNQDDFEIQNPTPKAKNSVYQVLPPEGISDLTIDSQNSYGNKVVLTWSTSTDPDSLSEELSYFLYYSKVKEELISTSTLCASTTATTFTISNLDYNSTYYFAILAFDGQNYSSLSNVVSYRTATLTNIARGFPDNLFIDNNGRKIARASNGNLYVVYSQDNKIFLAKSEDNGLNWAEPVLISPPDESDQINPSLVIDSKDNLHIVWQGKVATSTFYQIRYRKYDGTFQEIENLTDNQKGNQEIPVIVVDSQNNLHLAWVDDRKNIYYKNTVEGQWKNVEIVKNYEYRWGNYSSISQFSLAIDNQDILHFVWFETISTGWGSYVNLLRHLKGNSNNWSEIKDLTVVDLQNYSSMVIDSQNNLHIVWHKPYRDKEGWHSLINYIKYTKGWGKIETLSEEENNFVTASPSITLDSRNYLYLVWKRQDLKPLSQIEYKEGSWQEVKELISPFKWQGFPNLFYQANQPKTGYAFIFYQDGELKFYASQDLSW